MVKAKRHHISEKLSEKWFSKNWFNFAFLTYCSESFDIRKVADMVALVCCNYPVQDQTTQLTPILIAEQGQSTPGSTIDHCCTLSNIYCYRWSGPYLKWIINFWHQKNYWVQIIGLISDIRLVSGKLFQIWNEVWCKFLLSYPKHLFLISQTVFGYGFRISERLFGYVI